MAAPPTQSVEDDKTWKVSWFWVSLFLWFICSLSEIYATHFQYTQNLQDETKIVNNEHIVANASFTILLLAIPSLIHLWIWSCLLKKYKNDPFCRFFDLTMLLSVLSFAIPHIIYNIFLLFNCNWLLGLGFWITLLLLSILIIMIALVNYEMVTSKVNPETVGDNQHQPGDEEDHQDVKLTQSYNRIENIINPFLQLWRWIFSLDSWNYCFRINNLKESFPSYPFWRVLHFFAIFLSISYVWGFFIAFYNKDYEVRFGKPALVMEKLNEVSAKETPTPSPTPNASQEVQQSQATVNKNAEKQQETPKTPPITMPICFFFPDGEGTFIRDEPAINESVANDPMAYTDDLRRKIKNNKSITEVINHIVDNLKDLPDDETIAQTNNKILSISINGYADPKPPPKEKYASNSDLSRVRAEIVLELISRKLKDKSFRGWSQLKFNLTSRGSEKNVNMIDCEKSKNEIDIFKEKFAYARVVEIYIAESNDQQIENIVKTRDTLDEMTKQINNISNKQDVLIQLARGENSDDKNKPNSNYREPHTLDYIYFTVGVITTNAAGDIKPVTPFARFLIAIISFFQIFFLIGFFSTLISLQGNEEYKEIAEKSDKILRKLNENDNQLN